MPTQRTAKRRTEWFEYHTILTLNSAERHNDILEDSLAEQGLTEARGFTVMRIFGTLTGVLWTASASTPTIGLVRCGIAWIPEAVAGLGDGATGVPEPLQNGDRQARWIQQGLFYAEETGSTPIVGKPSPLDGVNNTWKFDTSQMSKQPRMDSVLALMLKNPGTFETDALAVNVDISTLIALP